MFFFVFLKYVAIDNGTDECFGICRLLSFVQVSSTNFTTYFVDLNISVGYCINPSHCTILETRGMKCRAHSHVAIRNYDHSFILFHYF